MSEGKFILFSARLLLDVADELSSVLGGDPFPCVSLATSPFWLFLGILSSAAYVVGLGDNLVVLFTTCTHMGSIQTVQRAFLGMEHAAHFSDTVIALANRYLLPA